MLTTVFTAMYAEKSVVYPGKEQFTHVLWTQYTAFDIE